jgi:gas vesicle protein
MSRAEMLAAIGLQSKRSAAGYVLPAIGMFGVGILCGAGLGLLFAPRTGREMRREIGTRVNTVASKLKENANKLKTKMKAAKDEVESSIDEARESLYGSSDYSGSTDVGMDVGRRTGLST